MSARKTKAAANAAQDDREFQAALVEAFGRGGVSLDRVEKAIRKLDEAIALLRGLSDAQADALLEMEVTP